MLLLFGEFVIRRFPLKYAATALILVGATVAGCDREKQADGQAVEASTKSSAGQGADGSAAIGGEEYRLDRSHKGKMAPDAAFSDADGKSVTLADFRGKPLLVNLWATWCAPCVAEMPTIDALAAKWQGKRHIITVSQDLQGAKIVGPWMEQAKLQHLPPYTDPDNGLLDAVNAPLPTTIYYDAEGRELWRVIGALDWMGAEAAALLDEAV